MKKTVLIYLLIILGVMKVYANITLPNEEECELEIVTLNCEPSEFNVPKEGYTLAHTLENARSGEGRNTINLDTDVPDGVDECAWNEIRDEIRMGSYQATPKNNGGYRLSNLGQNFLIDFEPSGTTKLRLHDQEDQAVGVDFRFVGLGYEKLKAYARPQTIYSESLGKSVGSKVTYGWSENITEWWMNQAQGLEQWFYVKAAPTGKNPGDELRLRLALDTKLETNVTRKDISFTNGQIKVHYNKFKAWDATGKALDVHFAGTGDYVDLVINDDEAVYPLVIDPLVTGQTAYLKAEYNLTGYDYGVDVAVDGNTIVVGARNDGGTGSGINPPHTFDNATRNSGAIYVYIYNGTNWVQQAYIKAADADRQDQFGEAVAISGETIVVGAPVAGVGAFYVFTRSGGLNGTWSQQTKVSSPVISAAYRFGGRVDISGDDIIVGAVNDRSPNTGVSTTPANNATAGNFKGAAYIYRRTGTNWNLQAYLKASNTETEDFFGIDVAIDGETAIVGAYRESSSSASNQANNGAADAGAAYVYTRSGSTWSQQAYIKPSTIISTAEFGSSVDISGETIVVSAPGENSDQGAAYVFTRSGSAWSQQAKLTASNADLEDSFGGIRNPAGDDPQEMGKGVSIQGDRILIGAFFEDSNATGIDGNQGNNSAGQSGAAYLYERSGTTWSQTNYIKASNTQNANVFGGSVALGSDHLVIGASTERSQSTGVNGSQTQSTQINDGRGAAYTFELAPSCNAGSTAPSLSGTTATNSCPGTTANLNALHNGTTPAGTTLVWSTDGDASNGLSSTTTSPTSTAGTYYAYYFDAANDCYSPRSVAVTVTITSCCDAGNTAPALTAATASNSCPGTTADLTSITATNTPSGTISLEWHTNANPSGNGTLVGSPNAVGAGTYHGVFHDTANDCYSPSTAVTVTITTCITCDAGNAAPNLSGTMAGNICPASTVDLNSITADNTPAGTSLQWHNTANPSNSSTLVADETMVGDGTYHAVFYDATDGGCYSPSTAMTVTISGCCMAGNSAPALDGSVATAFCDNLFQDLDAYTNSTPPSGTTLTWSTNSDPLVAGDHLANSTVNSAGTYYGFWYDQANTCASPTLQIDLTLATSPDAGTDGSIAACNIAANGATNVDLDDQLGGTPQVGTWSITSDPSGGSVSIGAGNVVDFNGLANGSYVFTYTVTAMPPCTDATTTVTVSVNPCDGSCPAQSRGISVPID